MEDRYPNIYLSPNLVYNKFYCSELVLIPTDTGFIDQPLYYTGTINKFQERLYSYSSVSIGYIVTSI